MAKVSGRKGTLKGGTFVKSAEGNRTFGKSSGVKTTLKVLRSARTTKLAARRKG